MRLPHDGRGNNETIGGSGESSKNAVETARPDGGDRLRSWSAATAAPGMPDAASGGRSMRIALMVAAAFVISTLAWMQVAEAQNTPASPIAPLPAANTAPPAVAERADQLLKQMSDYIGSAEQFTFHADITFDHVLPSGQKLQFSAAEDVALKRPGGLYVEWNGDLGDRQFWYDGKSVTLYDPSTVFYASEAAPAEMDKMLEELLP